MSSPKLLTESDIELLDKEIDEWVATIPAFRNSSVGLVAVLIDAFEKNTLERAFELSDVNFHREISEAMDDLDFCLGWGLDYCNDDNHGFVKTEGSDLLKAARAYFEILKCMRKLRKGQAQGHFGNNGQIIICEDLSQTDLQRYLCDVFVKRLNNPFFENEHEVRTRLTHDSIVLDCQPVLADRRIYYKMPPKIIKKVCENAYGWMSDVWKLSPFADLGGYTAETFRCFWSTLYAISYIHHVCCLRTYGDTRQVKGVSVVPQNLVMKKKRNEWIRMLSELSGIARQTVGKIIDDLTFEPTKMKQIKESQNRPLPGTPYEVLATPFFDMGNSVLHLTHTLPLKVNIGRAISNFLKATRPRVYTTIQNEMEASQKARIQNLLSKTTIQSHLEDVRIRVGSQSSDIDLFMWNTVERTLVACQLKAFKDPHRPKEYQTVQEALAKGIEQGHLSKLWMEQNAVRLSNLTGLLVSELALYQLDQFLISESTLALDVLFDSTVPTINECILQAVLISKNTQPLRTLGTVGRNQSYLPIPGKHYASFEDLVKFWLGPFRFEHKTLAYKVLEKWNPLQDLNFS